MGRHGTRGHAFIVRMWAEPREIQGAVPLWRGFIEHVGSGERRYLRDPDDILEFIGPFAAERELPPGMSASPDGLDCD